MGYNVVFLVWPPSNFDLTTVKGSGIEHVVVRVTFINKLPFDCFNLAKGDCFLYRAKWNELKVSSHNGLSSSPSEKHGWRVLGGMMGPVQ